MTESVADIFRAEAGELLAELEEGLLELESAGKDTEVIAQVFRTLHTLKGAGAITGFESVSTVVHEVESAFEMVRRGTLPVSRELINLTLQVRDQVRLMVAAEPTSSLDREAQDLVSRVKVFIGRDVGKGPSAAQASSSPVQDIQYRVRFTPPADMLQSGINPVGIIRELSQLGPCQPVLQLARIVPLEELDAEHCYLDWEIMLTTSAGEDAIRDAFIFLSMEDCLQIEKFEREGTPGDAPDAAAADAQLYASSYERRQRQASAAESRAGIRVRTERLDALVNLVGEMVTLQARLSQLSEDNTDQRLQSLAEDVERLTWEMRDQVLNIRMLPIGTTFSKFRRVVRDLGVQLDKEVDLTTDGAETELDKMMIDKLQEPLMHLLRNAIDHGIESSEQRRQAGKPARGRIHLAARQSGPNVILSIRDDGAGIDREAIRRKALDLGMDAASIDALDDKELIAMIFHAGFSTARKLTSISGRGVGMDVVRQAIETMRGSIEVDSKRGQGTTFSIRLPLTLAIIDGLLVQTGDDHFVFPLASVEECIELHQREVVRHGDRQLIELRDEIIPYIRLREQFGIAGERPAIEQVVIVDVDGQRVGYAVDHVVGSHQTVIKSLSRIYRDIQAISGATILGDGKVALILDPQRLLYEAELNERRLVA